MGATAKTVDMSQVKDRGDVRPKHLPEGDYPAKVLKVSDHKSKAGNASWFYVLQITDGTGKGASYPYYCGQSPDELWKIRNLFVACGINVPKKKIRLDPNRIVGMRVGITLEDDEYQGKPKSTVSGVLPIGEVGDAGEDADDDEVDIEDEEDETTDGDEFDAMDRAALKAFLVKADPTFKAKKSQDDDDLRVLARAAAEDEDEDEEEDETPPPPKKGKKSKRAAATVSDEELEELEVDEL